MKGSRGDGWVTRFGLIMAMAGNAVGLGNFLRFPGKAAPYGGAFMIPYFLALVLVGIPLMWVEWTIGRHGGGFGHGTTPGMFHRLWKHPISKYLGVFGVLIPAMVGVYYVYIESWSLGYAWLTATGQYWGRTSNDAMKDVFTTYLGIGGEGSVSFPLQAYAFFLITFAINITIFALGISKGIEVVAKYCMPALVVLGVVLMVRVLTLPPVDGRTIGDGLAQIWSIRDWSVLLKPDIWLAASGQIFFTLSVGLGMIHTYASYLRKHEDVVLSGLTACATNELVEVVIGASIAIPAAVLFFGVAQAQQIAEGGTFSIGFFALPVIFQQMPGGQFFGTIWFLLLFLAGLTSSMAMFTPLLVFLEDELRLPRRKGVALVAVMVFAMMQPVILFMKHGLVDELDYWMGEACLVLFVAIESVVFAWIFGMKQGWEEMHHGADIRLPKIFYYIIQWVTPTFVLLIVVWWLGGSFKDKLMMAGVPPESRPFLWLARIMMVGMLIFLLAGIHRAWKTHPKFFETVEKEPIEP